MENELLNENQKVATCIVNDLKDRNFGDEETMLDFGMNYDFYDGMIKGREEAIRLIKKAFQL